MSLQLLIQRRDQHPLVAKKRHRTARSSTTTAAQRHRAEILADDRDRNVRIS